MTHMMQQCWVIYRSLVALRVSRDTFARHQEHLNCIYSLWYYTPELLPAGFMGEMELTWSQFQLSHETGRQQLMRKIPDAVNTVKMLLMMSESIARNM